MTPATGDRFALAVAYEDQKRKVTRAFHRHGHGPAHRVELRKLAEISDKLHQAEIADGVTLGATRTELGFSSQ